MRIALCDDSRSETEHFIRCLHGWDPSRDPECFSDGTSLLKAAGRSPAFDIAFLDIYMPGENGVEIAARLLEISPDTAIVFVTTSRDHAVDAFSMQALHYLVKPVTTEGIVEAFRRLRSLRSKVRPVLTLTTGRDTYTVYLDEILRIQSDKHAKEIFLTGSRQIRIWSPLEDLSQKLDDRFLQLGRSTIVNMEQIEQMGTDHCVLRDGTRVEFTRRERNAVREAYDTFLFSRLSERQGF